MVVYARNLMGLFLFGLLSANAKTTLPTFTTINDPDLPEGFIFQGEYTGNGYGAQVIHLGNGHFQVVLFPGGLPGAGWMQPNKCLVSGTLMNSMVLLKQADGNRSYLATDPLLFSATQKFPPTGQKPYSGSIENEVITLLGADGEKLHLKKIRRKSPTLLASPPPNSIVLFDGSNKEHWHGGRIDPQTKLLHTDGKSIRTRKKFNNYHLHLEFMIPFCPTARGQQRGNSGIYNLGMYENQILDSFGLEGLHDECGGIYSLAKSKVNACLPPLSWQTYDIDFTNAKVENDTKVADARITVKLNGILIHDSFPIPNKTGGARNEPEGTPGAIKLQGHQNPLQFRNIWIIEK